MQYTGDKPNRLKANVTAMGIMTVRRLMWAHLAVVITGTTMRATSAGRKPLKILSTTGLLYMRVKKMAMSRIIMNEGRIVPNAAAKLPRTPRSLFPTRTAMLTANIPGYDCVIVSWSRNSSRLIHLCLSTTSRSMIGIIAHPPPKVNAPIFINVIKSCRYKLFIRSYLTYSAQRYENLYYLCIQFFG